MRVYSDHYNRRQSGSHSRKAEKQKKRFEERRERLGRPIDKAKSRKEFWAGYFSLIQKASEGLEAGYNINGGFEDRLKAQQEHFQSLPFRFVIRYLSDTAFSYMKKLPLSNGGEIPTRQPKGYRYAGTIPAAEKEKFLDELFEEEIEEIKMAGVPETPSGQIPRFNVYVRKDFSELKKDVQEIANQINENYGWAGIKIEDFMKATQPRMENIVY